MEGLTPRGLIVELVTPLDSTGGIHRNGLGRLLAEVLPLVQGVFLASPRAGEGTLLSTELRLELLKETISFLEKSPVPIFIWVSQASEEKTREAMRALGELLTARPYAGGIFFVDTPLYYHSNRGLPDLYREVCPTLGGSLILHNDPDLIQGLGTAFKRNNIRTAILKELAGFHEIKGMIFSGSLDRAHHYQQACRGRPDFRLYDGDEARFLDQPSRGGIVSMGANLAPAAWARVVASSLGPSADGVDYPDRIRQIWDMGRILRRMRDLYADAPAIIIKDFLSKMGILEPPRRPPEHIESLRDALRDLTAQLR